MMNKNINGLRIIETVRNFDEEYINNLIDKGYHIIVKRVEPLALLRTSVKILQHQKTKHIKVVNYGRKYLNGECNYNLLDEIVYYPYQFKNPYAAYLIPPNIQINERVFVADLIEDYIGYQHWRNYRLESCEALWDGKELKILYDEYEMPDVVG